MAADGNMIPAPPPSAIHEPSFNQRTSPLPSVHPAISRQYGWRYESPAGVGLKINLYRDWEVVGLASALAEDDLRGCPVECLMVGDSYFMTHLGCSSTRLSDEKRSWGLDTLTGLVVEVRSAMVACLPQDRLPYLIGDLPDGSPSHPGTMLRAASRFLAAGADVVKIEAGTPDALRCVEAAAVREIPTIVHLGYTPQSASLARHGDTVPDAYRVFSAARRARDAGACAIVLEMVSEPVNRALCAPSLGSLPVYSIFSGRATFGGQSLNAWDAAFRPTGHRRYFPPTAVLNPETDREAYTPKLLSDCLAQLMRLTLSGEFPYTPPTRMSPFEIETLLKVDPWRNQS